MPLLKAVGSTRKVNQRFDSVSRILVRVEGGPARAWTPMLSVIYGLGFI
jgi:hypothetical protein